MSLKWPSGAESGKEATFNNERANKWTDSIIPTENMNVLHLSGAGSQRTSEELSQSILYVLIGKVDMHIVSGNSAVVATTASLFWPGLIPNYFIPMNGNQFIAAISSISGGTIDTDVSVIECPD